MLLEYGASPLPNPSHFSLTSKFVAVRGDSNRMPMLETYIGTC